MLKICETEKSDQVGANRLVISGDPRENWYIGWAPTNEKLSAEGSWEEWVQLAEAILAENEKRRPRFAGQTVKVKKGF
jgi:hypothetical protein